MKVFKLLLGSLAALLLLVHCDNNKEDEFIPAGREELRLSTEIATVDLTGIETKADKGLYNDQFKLIVKDNTLNNYFTDKISTAETEASGSADKAKVTTLTPPLYWDDLGGRAADLKLAGVHPESHIATVPSDNKLSWSVRSDQNTAGGLNASDLMLAVKDSYKYTEKGTPANMRFNHVMTKITLKIKQGDHTAADIDGSTVTLINMPVSGKVSLFPNNDTECKYTYSEGTTGNVTPEKAAIQETSTTVGYSYTAIVYPFTGTKDSQIATITMGSNTYTINLPNDIDFKAGYNHIFNVTINKSKVSITASVADWLNQNEVALSSKLFNVGEIAIDDSEVSIPAGSLLHISIKGSVSSTTHKTIYVATTTGSGIEWVVKDGEKSIYWDDLDKVNEKYNCNTLTAMLLLEGKTDGESIFVSSGNTLNETIVSQYALTNKLSHPLAKFTITVETSDKEDKIELNKISSVTFASDWYQFKINNAYTGVEENTGNALSVTGPDASYKYVAFVCPSKTVNVNGTLCSVTVIDGSNTNVYPVKMDAAKTFIDGEHYQYKVKITKTEISFTGAIVNWSDQVEDEIDSTL